MKQISFSIKNNQELHASIKTVKQEVEKLNKVSSVLVSIFMDTANVRMLEEMKYTISAVFPEVQILGAVSMGAVVNGHFVKGDISVSFTLFECSEVRVLSFDFQQLNSRQAGREFLTALQADKGVVAAEILSAGFHLDITPFFREVSKSRRNIVFFGGLADDGSLGQNGMVYTSNTILRYGIAVAIFSGSKLHVQASSSFGWKPLGRCMTVTRMDGSFCLQEIDHRPALDIFNRYLGLENNDKFLVEALTFPLYFERHGTVLARHPRRCREDGSVMFGADIREGERIRLAYGDPEEIIENALDMQEKLALFQPEAIFVVSCVARWMLLGSDTEKEISVTRQLASSSGFYAYGEFMRDHNGEIMVSNMTIVTIGMREGLGDMSKEVKQIVHPRRSSRRLVMARLVRFIDATSRELEESKEKLERMTKMLR